MRDYNIESVKYVAKDGENVSIDATIDGEQWSVPINAEHNRHWKAIQAWVADGNTIEEAE